MNKKQEIAIVLILILVIGSLMVVIIPPLMTEKIEQDYNMTVVPDIIIKQYFAVTKWVFAMNLIFTYSISIWIKIIIQITMNVNIVTN